MTARLYVFHLVHGPLRDFHQDVERVLGRVRAYRFDSLSVPGVLCPGVNCLKGRDVCQLWWTYRGLAFASVLFPRNLYRVVALLMDNDGTFSAKRFGAGIRFVIRPLFARTLERSSIRERTRLYFCVFRLFFCIRGLVVCEERQQVIPTVARRLLNVTFVVNCLCVCCVSLLIGSHVMSQVRGSLVEYRIRFFVADRCFKVGFQICFRNVILRR